MKRLKIESNTLMKDVVEYAVYLLTINVAPSTARALKSKKNQLTQSYGKFKVSEMTPNEWVAHEHDFGEFYEPKTLEHFRQINRKVIELLINEGFLQESPLNFKKTASRSKGSKKAPIVFSKSDIQKLLTTESDYDAEVKLLQFGLTTGLRLGELMALNAESYDPKSKTYTVDLCLSAGVYKVVKTDKSQREVELCAKAIEAIEYLISKAKKRDTSAISVLLGDNKSIEYQARTLLAYSEKRGDVFTHVDQFAKDFFKWHCKLCGVKYISPMNLRHTYASQLITQSVPLFYVAQQMGHTEKELTAKHYTAWIKEDAAETYEKIDNHFDQYTQIEVKAAANDEIFEKENVVKPNLFCRIFGGLFNKKVS